MNITQFHELSEYSCKPISFRPNLTITIDRIVELIQSTGHSPCFIAVFSFLTLSPCLSLSLCPSLSWPCRWWRMATSSLPSVSWWHCSLLQTTVGSLTMPVQWWVWMKHWCVHFRYTHACLVLQEAHHWHKQPSTELSSLQILKPADKQKRFYSGPGASRPQTPPKNNGKKAKKWCRRLAIMNKEEQFSCCKVYQW